MGRLVETVPVGATAANRSSGHDGIDRIAKYIPAEVLAFYSMWTQASTMLPDTLPAHTLTFSCIIGIFVGISITYFYFDKFFPNADPNARKYHRIISPIAFLIYGYTIWGAVDSLYFLPGLALMATALLTLVSFIAAPMESIPAAGS